MVVRRSFAVGVRRAALVAGAVGVCATLTATGVPASADSADLGRVGGIELLNSAWSFDKAAVSIGLTYSTTDQRGGQARATAGLYLPSGLPPAGGWPLVVWA